MRVGDDRGVDVADAGGRGRRRPARAARGARGTGRPAAGPRRCGWSRPRARSPGGGAASARGQRAGVAGRAGDDARSSGTQLTPRAGRARRAGCRRCARSTSSSVSVRSAARKLEVHRDRAPALPHLLAGVDVEDRARARSSSPPPARTHGERPRPPARLGRHRQREVLPQRGERREVGVRHDLGRARDDAAEVDRERGDRLVEAPVARRRAGAPRRGTRRASLAGQHRARRDPDAGTAGGGPDATVSGDPQRVEHRLEQPLGREDVGARRPSPPRHGPGPSAPCRSDAQRVVLGGQRPALGAVDGARLEEREVGLPAVAVVRGRCPAASRGSSGAGSTRSRPSGSRSRRRGAAGRPPAGAGGRAGAGRRTTSRRPRAAPQPTSTSSARRRRRQRRVEAAGAPGAVLGDRRGQALERRQPRDLLDEVGLARDVVAPPVRHGDVEAVGRVARRRSRARRASRRCARAGRRCPSRRLTRASRRRERRRRRPGAAHVRRCRRAGARRRARS